MSVPMEIIGGTIKLNKEWVSNKQSMVSSLRTTMMAVAGIFLSRRKISHTFLVPSMLAHTFGWISVSTPLTGMSFNFFEGQVITSTVCEHKMINHPSWVFIPNFYSQETKDLQPPKVFQSMIQEFLCNRNTRMYKPTWNDVHLEIRTIQNSCPPVIYIRVTSSTKNCLSTGRVDTYTGCQTHPRMPVTTSATLHL